MDNDVPLSKILFFLIFSILFFIFGVFLINVVTITYGQMTNANDISCNWIFCTITYIEQNINRECYENGKKVECDNFSDFLVTDNFINP